ncbi:MAG: hypothetical protein GY775_16690 [Candidatus Scalindua sp.]|nr:hypothetical protein [Candidatus Scalindua sp.]
MKIFDHPNITNDWKCPICNSNGDKPVVLIGIQGTEKGNNMEAEQFHLDCIELTYFEKDRIIAQQF